MQNWGVDFKIGIELYSEYFKIAKSRLKKHLTENGTVLI
jgi:hypothetical protein